MKTIKAPWDTVKVIQTLIDESERNIIALPMPYNILLRGAIEDAKGLVAEIKANNPEKDETK